MKSIMACITAVSLPLMLSGCVPRIEIATPTAPITINMNVKIEHEIHIKVDKDVEDLLKNKSDLF
ncbi:YnbE family lipoprotein [Serratia sp. M24T3]|uniref:YnbE family lipoprotein n=1 Tax=Rouxiella sp. WC2420 TaxID=3234145 RepID=A0AB39VLN9_9GAMM|nr:YnbE family lipoprotein [Serratia sp. M24T3]EIC85185.1 lipoprotein [Serratia sp. M24T3]